MLYILVGLGVLAVFVTSIAEHALEEQRQQAKVRVGKNQESQPGGEPAVQE